MPAETEARDTRSTQEKVAAAFDSLDPPERPWDHPKDAMWLFREQTLHSRQILEDAMAAAEKYGDDWDEHAFGPAETLEAHPVKLVVCAALHIHDVAKDLFRRTEAWEDGCGPLALYRNLKEEGVVES